VPASAREFSEFNGLLGSVIERGLPLPPALRLLSVIVRDGSLREGLARVAREIDEGTSLADALGRHPESFPPEYCGLVRAGIDSGRLPEVLRTAQVHHSLRARLRARMGRLMLYLASGAIIGELVLFIGLLLARKMMEFNAEVARELEMKEVPDFIEYLNAAISSGWGVLLLWPGLLAVAAASFWLLQRWSRLGWLGYAVPVWGRIQKSRDLALFSCVLGLKLRSGASIADALRSGRDAVVNAKFRYSVDQLIRRTGEGESLSSALFYTEFFPRTLAWGISLGEENGEVPRTVDTFTALYTAEMERNFELLVDILTPLGILAVGNLALGSALLILSPFFMTLRIQMSLSR